MFINPALTEPFGLTLLEAAASGLPIVATNDGGPRDIIANCQNGLLIDPLDAEVDRESSVAGVDRTQAVGRMVRAGDLTEFRSTTPGRITPNATFATSTISSKLGDSGAGRILDRLGGCPILIG